MDTVLLGGLVLGLIQLAKVTIGITSRYIPITAFVLSLAMFGLYAFLNHVGLSWSIVSTALVTALSAVGMWSGVSSTLG